MDERLQEIKRLREAIGLDFEQEGEFHAEPVPQVPQGQETPSQSNEQGEVQEASQPLPQEQQPEPQAQQEQATPPALSAEPGNKEEEREDQKEMTQPVQEAVEEAIPPQPVGERPSVTREEESIVVEEDPPETSLFVKIDRHEDFYREIVGARTSMKKIIGLIKTIAKLEELKGKAITSIDEEVRVLEEKLKNMRHYLKSDRELGLRERHDSGLGTTDDELETLLGLHEEIEKLKDELSRL